MDAMTEVTKTEKTTPPRTSIKNLIGMLRHLAPGTETYFDVLDELLNHDDLSCPEDLQLHVERFCDREWADLDEFRISLNDASLSMGASIER
jgi:hypothetical protein